MGAVAWLPSDTSLPYLSWQRRRCTPKGGTVPRPPPAPHRSWGATALRGHLPAPHCLSVQPPPSLPGGPWQDSFPALAPRCQLAGWLARGDSCSLSLAERPSHRDRPHPRPPPSKALVGKLGPRGVPDANTAHPQGRGRTCAALATGSSLARCSRAGRGPVPGLFVCGAGPGQERPWLT